MIAEPPRRIERFSAHGEGAEMFLWLKGTKKPPKGEIIFAGVAGSGKTRLISEFIVQGCEMYPGTKVLLYRKTRASMNESVLDTLENEVLGPNSPIVLGRVRSHRDKYTFPNGSEIVTGGMDNPTKMFSTQYHWAWGNEINEMAEPEFELLWRALRRPGGPPFKLNGGDCNPDTDQHWAYQRCQKDDAGRTQAHMMVGRFWDNPRWYNHDTETWTEEGIEYLQGLAGGLSGVRFKRLFKGLWVAAEGMVWETYDPQRHLIDGRLEGNAEEGISLWQRIGINADGHPIEKEIRLRWFLAAHDFGTRNAGALQIWGFDSESRMYLVAEHYHQGMDYDWWAEQASELYREFRYDVGVCDHAPSAIPVFNKRCSLVANRDMPTLWREWSKQRGPDREMTGIDQVRVRFRQDAMFILRGCLRKADPELRRKKKPTCFENEILQYVYDVTKDGKRHKEKPSEGCENHAADAARGAASWAFLRDLSTPERKPEIPHPPGTMSYQFERWRRDLGKQKKDSRW